MIVHIPGDPVSNNLRNAINVRCDNRLTLCHRLENGKRQTLSMSTKNEDVQRGHNLCDVGSKSSEDEMALDPKLAKATAHLRIVHAVEFHNRVVAYNNKSDIGTLRENQRSRRSERIVILLWIDPGNHSHQSDSVGHP